MGFKRKSLVEHGMHLIRVHAFFYVIGVFVKFGFPYVNRLFSYVKLLFSYVDAHFSYVDRLFSYATFLNSQ